jgi:hypothetical protein
MPPPAPQTAYMSINPLEPVIVFRNSYDAKEYQDNYNSLARIYKDRPRQYKLSNFNPDMPNNML